METPPNAGAVEESFNGVREHVELNLKRVNEMLRDLEVKMGFQPSSPPSPVNPDNINKKLESLVVLPIQVSINERDTAMKEIAGSLETFTDEFGDFMERFIKFQKDIQP